MARPVSKTKDQVTFKDLREDEYMHMNAYGWGFAIGYAGLAPKYAFKLYGSGDDHELLVELGYIDGIEMFCNTEEYLPDLDQVEFDDAGNIIWDTEKDYEEEIA